MPSQINAESALKRTCAKLDVHHECSSECTSAFQEPLQCGINTYSACTQKEAPSDDLRYTRITVPRRELKNNRSCENIRMSVRPSQSSLQAVRYLRQIEAPNGAAFGSAECKNCVQQKLPHAY